MATVSGNSYRPPEPRVTGPLPQPRPEAAGKGPITFPAPPTPSTSPAASTTVQQYTAAEYAPNSVRFTPAATPRAGDSGSTRTALETALKQVLPQTTNPAVQNALARGLGFKDFNVLCQTLSKLPPEQQQKLIQTLSSATIWQSQGASLLSELALAPQQADAAFSCAGQPLLSSLSQQVNTQLQTDIQALFPTAQGPSFEPDSSQWSPAALLGIHNSLSQIKTHSPADFSRIAQASPGFKFKLENNPTSTEPVNIALQDPFSLINDSMKIAHTSCQGCAEHTITVRPGAVQGSAESILNGQILDKLSLFNRKNTDLNYIGNCKDGKKQWYTEQEMRQRGLLEGNPPAINRDKALELLSSLNQDGTSAEQTWRSLVSFANAAGVFQSDLLKNDSVLKKYLKPGSAGLDMDKVWDVFYKTKNPEEIKQIQDAVNRHLSQTGTHKQVLANMVFKMEQMKQVQGLQNFLNGIQPDAARDLLKDGTVGPRTQSALQRLEGIMALNALKKNFSSPPTEGQSKAADDILKVLTATTFDANSLNQVKTKMKELLKQIPDRTLQESPPKTLSQTMGKLIDRIDGIFNQETTTDLVDNWLSVVDSANEGHVLSDLVTHEVGHNLMEIFKREHADIPLDRDWASIAGKADQQGADNFSVTPMTRSFFRNEHEEVSDYGESSPNEDFAESYRLFMSNPEDLLKRAPTKFLVLNALSGRFSGAQLQEKFGTTHQAELQQAWDKLTGNQGAQYHLSAEMLALMQKTYGNSLSAAQNPSVTPEVSFLTTANQSSKSNTSDKANNTTTQLPLTTERLKTVKALKNPPLSEADLRLVDRAMQKLTSHIQSQGGTLSCEQARTLLGTDYDKLPAVFKNMLETPTSFVAQYLSNPDAPARSATSSWVRTEALEQIIRNGEQINADYVGVVGALDPQTGTRSGGTLNNLIKYKDKPAMTARFVMPSLSSLQNYFQKLNQWRSPPVTLPDTAQLEQYLKDLLPTATRPEDLLKQLQQKVGL